MATSISDFSGNNYLSSSSDEGCVLRSWFAGDRIEHLNVNSHPLNVSCSSEGTDKESDIDVAHFESYINRKVKVVENDFYDDKAIDDGSPRKAKKHKRNLSHPANRKNVSNVDPENSVTRRSNVTPKKIRRCLSNPDIPSNMALEIDVESHHSLSLIYDFDQYRQNKFNPYSMTPIIHDFIDPLKPCEEDVFLTDEMLLSLLPSDFAPSDSREISSPIKARTNEMEKTSKGPPPETRWPLLRSSTIQRTDNHINIPAVSSTTAVLSNTPTHVLARFDIRLPLGMSLSSDAIIYRVLEEGQANSMGLRKGGRVSSVNSFPVIQLSEIKEVLDHCRNNDEHVCLFGVQYDSVPSENSDNIDRKHALNRSVQAGPLQTILEPSDKIVMVRNRQTMTTRAISCDVSSRDISCDQLIPDLALSCR